MSKVYKPLKFVFPLEKITYTEGKPKKEYFKLLVYGQAVCYTDIPEHDSCRYGFDVDKITDLDGNDVTQLIMFVNNALEVIQYGLQFVDDLFTFTSSKVISL